MIKINLQSIAESKGFNMSQVQRQSGLTMGLVRRYWYNETEEVKLSALEKLCMLLGCTPGDMIQLEPSTTLDPLTLTATGTVGKPSE